MRLATPSAGARVPSDARSGREPRAAPNPVERMAIETAVNTASSTSASTLCACDSIEATRRMPTPALPPIPWTSPIPKAPSFVRPPVRVRVLLLDGVEPAPPAEDQAHGEVGDHECDGGLGTLLDGLGEVLVQQQDREAEREQRRRMAEAPRRAEAERGPLARRSPVPATSAVTAAR